MNADNINSLTESMLRAVFEVSKQSRSRSIIAEMAAAPISAHGWRQIARNGLTA